MKSISVILGAGFSHHAEIPAGKVINKRFNTSNISNLSQMGSGEIFWSDPEKNNYVTYEVTAMQYTLNSLYQRYIQKSNRYNNYEEYYQFISDELDKAQILAELSNQAYQMFHEDRLNKYSKFDDSNYRKEFKDITKKKILNMFNYLIADLLTFDIMKISDYARKYVDFLNLIAQYDEVNIFTLNHDLLLETLFSYFEINYADGFSTAKSILWNTHGEKIKCYDGNFNSRIKLMKLHGSINLYRYDYYYPNGAFNSPMPEYKYFKPENYQDKHSPIRVNPLTGETVQTFHINIVPCFITGTKKDKIIRIDKMYNELYESLDKNMELGNDLLIIGYSFKDEHINCCISKSITNRKAKRIINVNPTTSFPEDLIMGAGIVEIEQIADIAELA